MEDVSCFSAFKSRVCLPILYFGSLNLADIGTADIVKRLYETRFVSRIPFSPLSIDIFPGSLHSPRGPFISLALPQLLRMLAAAQSRLRLVGAHLARTARTAPPSLSIPTSPPRRMANTDSQQHTPAPTFPITPAPKTPEGQYVKTCGMIVIGDEVLNGACDRPNDGIDPEGRVVLSIVSSQARRGIATRTFSPRCCSTSRST